MSAQAHSAAPHHLPAFITAPGETDVLLVVTAVMLIVIVLIFGNLFLKLHTLPERLAHKGHKLQFEIVAVLGLLALFTHIHAFWVAGLLLALVDLPDFGTPLGRMASSLERIADDAGARSRRRHRRAPALFRSRCGRFPGRRERRSSAGGRRRGGAGEEKGPVRPEPGTDRCLSCFSARS